MFFICVLACLEPKRILIIMRQTIALLLDTVLEQSLDKLIPLTDSNNGVLNHHALLPCFATACLCLPWPLTFYYLSHTDTSHLHWSASGLAPLLSLIPAVVTPNTALQGSVPIYNGGGFFLLYCCCLPALPPFIHWPLLYFLFVHWTSGHPKASLVNPLHYSG